MYRALILAIFALFFASCHNEVPDLPTPDEAAGYVYCGYKDKDAPGELKCRSSYEVDCDKIIKLIEENFLEGGLFCDANCKDPVP